MFFKTIELENFGIFYGRQKISLGPGLHIVHGENGRGKTTLLNAVRWAFFGTFENRQGQSVSSRVVLNRDARREGATRFAVAIEIEDRGERYLIRRSTDLSDGNTAVLYVERGGQPLSQADASHTVGTLLNPRVARFFLFDGEQLREYEELLFSDEVEARFVKTSIEQILGLPVFDNTVEDLAAVKDAIGKRVAKIARQNEKTRRLGLQAAQLEEEIRDAEEDLLSLESLKADAQERIRAAEGVLQQYESSQEILKKIESIETEIGGLEEMAVAAADQRSQALAGVWLDVLYEALRPRRQFLAERLDEERQRQKQLHIAHESARSLEDGRCALCERALNGSAAAILEEKASQDDVVPREGVDTFGSGDLYRDFSDVASIGQAGRLADVIAADRKLADLRTRIVVKKQELAQTRAVVEGLPELQVREAAQQRDSALQELGQINHLIGNGVEDLKQKKATLVSIRRDIAASGVSDEIDLLRNRESLVNEVQELFAAAKAQFREALKSSIEADATKLFLKLTTEVSHAGLRINDSYGLETFGADGAVIEGRSAGQEQVVALSLIGALNRNASRRAPLMMDTPLGRLDKQHRANVLSLLADLAEQVFFLVHSAEVSDDDLAPIRSEVAKEWVLQRVGPERTEIREYRGLA